MTVQTPPAPSESDPAVDAGAIEDARRRHRCIGFVLLTAATAAAAIGFHLASGSPTIARHSLPTHGASHPRSATSARAVSPTRSPDLIQPTTLASLHDGDLLILDSSRDQILELKRDGALSIFAGNGRLGSTGDDGPAQDAELNLTYFTSAGLTVTPNGSVDLLDNGNCRVRQINPSGIIRTIFRMPLVKVSGYRATCRMTSVAMSPSGRLYVATGSRIQRLSRRGRLVWVAGNDGSEVTEPANPTPSSVVFAPVSIAFDHLGDLYIGSVSPKVVYRLSPGGKLSALGTSFPTQLSTDQDDGVLVGTHSGVIQNATPSTIHTDYTVNPRRVTGINWRRAGFQENGITVARGGAVYADNAQGNGSGSGTVLVRISPSKRASLVPIRTSLTATLPTVGAAGFPASLYPAARPSRGAAIASCPSDEGLERFTPRTIAQARRAARSYLSQQFASDITVTDRAWWTQDFDEFAAGADLGSHTILSEAPTSEGPIATGLSQACGPKLIKDSISVAVGESAYSSFAGTLYFLDRDGHPLVYDVGRSV